MRGRRGGKRLALATSLSTRTGTSVAQILRMMEEGGTFTLANGEKVLFVTLMEPLPGELRSSSDSYAPFR
jgi:hypothetical protein